MPTISAVAESELHALYAWVDEIPLSRPKKNIARDFSDGVLTAEIVAHFFPKAVELHNYSGAHKIAEKMYNWNTLNVKVFKRLGFSVPEAEVKAVVNAEPGAIERVLKLLKVMIERQKGDYGYEGSPGGAYSPVDPAQGRAVGGNPGRGAQGQQAPYQGGGAGAAPSPVARAALQGNPALPGVHPSVAAKDATILELRQTNEILETKVRKLEQLVRLKDAKIQTLIQKLQGVGIS